MVAAHMTGKVGFPLLSVPATWHKFAESFGTDCVKLTCPISTSAGCWFLVGIEFQISTRLKPRSATYSRWPSLVTETGLSIVLAVAGMFRSI